jgi:hypothetical protein
MPAIIMFIIIINHSCFLIYKVVPCVQRGCGTKQVGVAAMIDPPDYSSLPRHSFIPRMGAIPSFSTDVHARLSTSTLLRRGMAWNGRHRVFSFVRAPGIIPASGGCWHLLTLFAIYEGMMCWRVGQQSRVWNSSINSGNKHAKKTKSSSS